MKASIKPFAVLGVAFLCGLSAYVGNVTAGGFQVTSSRGMLILTTGSCPPNTQSGDLRTTGLTPLYFKYSGGNESVNACRYSE